MEIISDFIASRICGCLGFGSKKKQVMEIGITTIVQLMTSVFFILLIGSMLHAAVEALVIFLTVNIFRKYTMGAALSSRERRIFMGSFAAISAAIMLKSMNYNFRLPAAALLVYVISYYIIIKNAPVELKINPDMYEGKRKRMKESAIKTLNISFMIIIINLLNYYLINFSGGQVFSACIIFGIGWQTLMLTAAGRSLMEDIDWILDEVIRIVKR